jgi:hypothetical protein
MKDVILARSKEISQTVHSLAQGLRRGVIAACAAIALIVIYGVSFIGAHALSIAGISTLALTTTANQAYAGERRRHRGDRGYRGDRRRRQGRRRHRRRRGNVWEWYWAPYWYNW